MNNWKLDVNMNRRMMTELVKEQALIRYALKNHQSEKKDYDLFFEVCFRIFAIEEYLIRLKNSELVEKEEVFRTIFDIDQRIVEIEQKFMKFLKKQSG